MRVKASRSVLNKMHRNKGQIIFQSYKDTGNGGQYKNKTETGVRLTDSVTGIVVERCVERKQYQNRKLAMEALITKLLEYYQAEEKREREEQIKENKEVVRSYKVVKDMVHDHRIPGKTYSYREIISGKGLGKIIEDLQREELNSRIKEDVSLS